MKHWLSILFLLAVGSQAATITGVLTNSTVNTHYFVDSATGKAVALVGSHTWNSFQDTDTSATPAAMAYDGYVSMLVTNGHNCTILWKKDLPTYCSWGPGGTWHMTLWPWNRTGPGNASDGLAAFDLTTTNQAYFDRLRARTIQLQTNGIYAIVQLFDGLGLVNNRCAGDGYPFTSGNNINGISDGGGVGSMNMTGANAITAVQDAYVKKVIDTVNDLPNVLYEICEESQSSSWWNSHMIGLIHSYEAGKALQHPSGIGQGFVDIAEWVATGTRIDSTNNCGSGTPACKVQINDSDHSYFGMWNDTAQQNRNYLWENFCAASPVIFMDPFLVNWSGRNAPTGVANGMGTGIDTRWDNFRKNMGQSLVYSKRVNLLAMAPQASLASTTWCLACTIANSNQFIVYAPTGGTFTVNLSTASGRVIVPEWFDPATLAVTAGTPVNGGSAAQSFSTPGGFSADSMLLAQDSSLTNTATAASVASISITGTMNVNGTIRQ